MDVTVTNISSPAENVFLADVYVELAAGKSITFSRSAADLPRMKNLQDNVAAGKVTVSVTPTAAELASGLMVAPQALEAVDLAPVAAAAANAVEGSFRAIFAAGGGGAPDDVTVYAVNMFPFKARILWARAVITTAVGASTLEVRTAAAGGGTLLATLSSASAGPVPAPTAGFTASTVVTPGAIVGLFVRRSDNGVAGEVQIPYRRES